ncbi:radical SAM (seleno)protein TrsS [Desulfotalea psychrophila]|uniref:Radical SAM core domain-containing protein n=1 Tax=Desulfotalea psychrophila (strain LSv54 / DSM 12343) TaxID=177439 RepID=Q6ARN1_DESPS|nr:radical SAM (seleno)protein TrsS [Desulfotalea psychrophila]CAG34994.1 conserved hypothetical protein [Desulfotalea psychrophila LSv54]
MNSIARSVCPVCLKAIPAHHETIEGNTYLLKECPEHGAFKTVVWRAGTSFKEWSRTKIPSQPKTPFTAVDRGCPYDCGLCAAHGQHTCTALLEVTWRCDLGCPVCFASSGKKAAPDPSQAEISQLLERVELASGFCNIQLSGGEPTMRDDLAELIALAKKRGFPFIQLNTNGLRIAREEGYAQRLAEAGLDSVFLQFDGTEDAIYSSLRGRPLMAEKRAAIEALSQAGIGIVLVPVVVPGLNDHNLGAILDLAVQNSPHVRGVHFQPVSYFGRYPQAPGDEERITLPELMDLLEVQSGGAVHAADFQPPGCEHSHCSFNGNYMVTEEGGLTKLSAGGKCDCAPRPAREGADKAKSFVKRQWAGVKQSLPMAGALEDDLGRFISRAASHSLAISAMAFQDAWTLDFERLRGCCIHVVSPDGRLIPFCAYNLTSMDGETLYRGKCNGPIPS